MIRLATKEQYQHKAEVAKALAHWSRLMIVDALAGGDQSVGRLTEMVGSDVSTVSRHLSVLKAVGIVTARKNGNQVLYHLETPCVTDFFDCALEVLRQSSATQQRAISG
ncbi:MAG: metalloregulator ArsR/SmtB family transcription factor [Proteobacteria bacterium]|nr:metalloregulator ArsR/SmtB family transcription factor [Pseudomonadota bacterium]MBU1741036.1 metalloregulator ArsR/SmtB family transcription factor [Pseudomonadota bacterium]